MKESRYSLPSMMTMRRHGIPRYPGLSRAGKKSRVKTGGSDIMLRTISKLLYMKALSMHPVRISQRM